MISELHLSALLCSRICHDLISPISALNNGIEVLEDDDDEDEEMREHALSLIALGGKQASSKLRFARLAYGASSATGEIVDLAEVKEILEEILDGGKITLKWESAHDGLQKDFVRILMNLVSIGSGCIPRGGVLRVDIRNTSGPAFMSLTASGEGADIKPEVIKALDCASAEKDLDARSIQPFFTGLLIQSNGIRLKTEKQSEQIVFQASS